MLSLGSLWWFLAFGATGSYSPVWTACIFACSTALHSGRFTICNFWNLALLPWQNALEILACCYTHAQFFVAKIYSIRDGIPLCLFLCWLMDNWCFPVLRNLQAIHYGHSCTDFCVSMCLHLCYINIPVVGFCEQCVQVSQVYKILPLSWSIIDEF